MSTICYSLAGFARIKRAFLEIAERNGPYMDIKDEWLAYYDKTLAETKASWGGILETACYLHPGLDHGQILSEEDRHRVISFIKDNKGWSDITRSAAVSQLLSAPERGPIQRPQEYHAHIPVREGEDEEHVSGSPIKVARSLQTGTSRKASKALLAFMDDSPTTATSGTLPSVLDEISSHESIRRARITEPVSFWEEYACRLPRLAVIANRMMAIMPSSAATERMFSVSKRIQRTRRAHLSDTVVEDFVIVVSNPDIAETAYDIVQAADHAVLQDPEAGAVWWMSRGEERKED